MLHDPKPDVAFEAGIWHLIDAETKHEWISRAKAAGWLLKWFGKGKDYRLKAWSPETLAAIAEAEALEPEADVLPFRSAS
jgi:hypothetical protein